MSRPRGAWKTLASSVAYRNPWFHVRRDRVVRPDGQKGHYHVVVTRGATVLILPVNEKGELCLVQLFRYPTGRWSWEVPGGNTDGQPPLVAAKRELREETGLRARSWKRAGVWQTVNGLSSELSYAFVARGLSAAGAHSMREEGIRRARFFAPARVFRMVRDGELTDGQTIAALFVASFALAREHRAWAALAPRREL